MASDNDVILDVISNSAEKISIKVKSKHDSNNLEKHESALSDQFERFRDALWATYSQLNPYPQQTVVEQETPSIVVGGSAVFYPRRPRM
jgi:hypothetical protein